MPTKRPRYTLTDTGGVARALDAAERHWPGRTRRELLDCLLGAGEERLHEQEAEREQRLGRQRRALHRIRELVDVDALLSDQAWR